jgi:hypothetical protein
LTARKVRLVQQVRIAFFADSEKHQSDRAYVPVRKVLTRCPLHASISWRGQRFKIVLLPSLFFIPTIRSSPGPSAAGFVLTLAALGFSLPLSHLLLMPLHLGPPLILLLSLTPHLPSLPFRRTLIPLDVPVSLPFPVAVATPAPPVPFEPSVRDRPIVPPVPAPVTVSVKSSPTRIYIKIKTWNTVIIPPAPVIIM